MATNSDEQGRKRRMMGASARDVDSGKLKAIQEAAARRTTKTNWKKKFQYFAIVGTTVVVLLGMVMALVWSPGGGRKRSAGSGGPSRLDQTVNDASFIRSVTRNSDGNFTAAASPFFEKWTYGDVKWGMSGVSVSDMVGMAGAAKYCEKEDEVEGGVVPVKFDARVEWPNCVSPVRDSGNCSASYAIAAADSVAQRYCIADAVAYGNVKLSAQQILSCDKKSRGCQGGVVDAVWAYVQRRGLYPEQCVPYAGKAGAACKTDCSDDKKMKILDHCVLGGTKAIKREIRSQGPVVAPLYIQDDFLVYSGGVYSPTDQAAVQYGANDKAIIHAVKIVGWGKAEGVNYWLIENSWGSGWGEEGFARVAMGTVIRENYIMVGKVASEENVALAEKKKAEQEARAEELKKERAERDERIRERQRIREEEMRAAREAAEEEDFDKEFDDDLDIDLDEADDGVEGAEQKGGDGKEDEDI